MATAGECRIVARPLATSAEARVRFFSKNFEALDLLAAGVCAMCEGYRLFLGGGRYGHQLWLCSHLQYLGKTSTHT